MHTAVGNLAYDLSEQDVIDYFSSVGPVKAVRIVLDKETGKPRGFGFVEYHDIPTAESCVRNLGGTELNGINEWLRTWPGPYVVSSLNRARMRGHHYEYCSYRSPRARNGKYRPTASLNGFHR